MSKKKKAAAAGATAVESVQAVKSSPLVQTITQDSELHDNVKVAYDSARHAYERLASGKTPPKALLEDKKLHKELQTAATALRDVGNALRETPVKKKKSGGLGRKLLVLVLGGAVAVAVSSDVRNKVLDLLFGAEEEFDYTSTTTPATPAPTAAA